MRLINIYSLELYDFATYPPPYAILSHRWQDAEITYDDFTKPETRRGPGFDKIAAFCEFLRGVLSHKVKDPILDDLRLFQVSWCWVDTCCIDKRSSAELSESINSMSAWYRRSQLCVVHMSDVQGSCTPNELEGQVVGSQWFRRGWTLQELIFPRAVVFCDQDWNMLPGLEKDHAIITKVTGIPEECLRNSDNVFRQSVARRMSWAARRTTTRNEDEAYCLLGLFGVNMPLLYGEGTEAFMRLQEEIMEQSNDESILAWSSPPVRNHPIVAFLARRPAAFEHSGNVFRAKLEDRPTYTIGATGLALEAGTVVFSGMSNSGLGGVDTVYALQLNCYSESDTGLRQACVIAIVKIADNVMARVPTLEIGETLWQRMIASSYNPVQKLDSAAYLLALTSNHLDIATFETDSDFLRGILTLHDMYVDLSPMEGLDPSAWRRSRPWPQTLTKVEHTKSSLLHSRAWKSTSEAL